MAVENKVGIFGNGPVVEGIRDFLSFPLFLYDYQVSGQSHLEIAKFIPTIICFFPHTSHLDPLSVRYASLKDVRKLEVFPAAADYWYRIV